MSGQRSWQSDLVSRYPDLFNVAKHGGSYTSGYPECGEGWRDQLERACVRMQAAVTADGGTFSATDQRKVWDFEILLDGPPVECGRGIDR